ncbi:MAG: hypothetical protein JXA15_01260 [Spirochaetales bacterium]|nr:hypothetical protein [Spirochaetales bacterium]
MNKALALAIAAVYLASQAPAAFAQESTGISEESSQQSMQDSTQQSSAATSEQSSANSETSSQDSSEQSFAESTDDSNASSADGEAGTVVLVVAGAVVVVAIVGVVLTVRASNVREEAVLGLQDQVYLADGPDYEKLAEFFELDARSIGRVHDELALARGPVETNQDAADFLAAFLLALAERSETLKARLGPS